MFIEVYARPRDAVAPRFARDVLEPDGLFVLLPASNRFRPELGEFPEKREQPDRFVAQDLGRPIRHEEHIQGQVLTLTIETPA